MRNEVYGEVKLDVSVPTDAQTEEMALLKAGYDYSDLGIREIVLEIHREDGSVEKVKVNGWEIVLDRFFGDGE